MKKILILITVIILTQSLSSAQTAVSYSWGYVADGGISITDKYADLTVNIIQGCWLCYTTDLPQWAGYYGVLSAGTSTTRTATLEMEIALPEPMTVEALSLILSENNTINSQYSVHLVYEGYSVWQQSATRSSGSALNFTLSWSGGDLPVVADTIYIAFIDPPTFAANSLRGFAISGTVAESINIAHPFTSSDTLFFDNQTYLTSVAIDDMSFVHAAVAGTVASVTPINCAIFDGCPAVSVNETPITVSQDNAYIVGIWTGTHLVYQTVRDPQVSTGDTVSAGCIMGYALRLDNMGVTHVTAYNETDRVSVVPSGYPTSNLWCTESNCLLLDSRLNNLDVWQRQGDVLDNPGGGFTLMSASGRIWQDWLLDDNTNYVLSVGVGYVPAGSEEIELSVYDEYWQNVVNAIDISPTPGVYQLQIPATSIQTETYNIGVSWRGAVGVQIDYICLHDEDYSPPPTTCYFQNPEFDNGADGWTNSGIFVPDNAGYIWLGAGYVGQDVTLEPGDYTVTVNFYGADPDNATNVVMSMTYPAGNTAFASAVSLANIQNGSVQSVTFDLSVETATSDLLTISAIYTDSNNDIVDPTFATVYITSICLSANGATEPGGCRVVDRPDLTNTTLSIWTVWHGEYITNYYDCELMPVLRLILQTVFNIYKWVTWSVSWNIDASYAYSDWMTNQLSPWLGGHFANIATGHVTNVSSGGCDNFWCAIVEVINALVSPINTLLEILASFTDILFTLIDGLLSLIFGAIALLFDLVNLARSLLASLLALWNTTPATHVGILPQCTQNYHSSGFCRAIWVMDNTIWSGRGAIVIPLLVSIMSIHMLIWAVERVRVAVFTAGNSL